MMMMIKYTKLIKKKTVGIITTDEDMFPVKIWSIPTILKRRILFRFQAFFLKESKSRMYQRGGLLKKFEHVVARICS